MKGFKVRCWDCNGTGEVNRPLKNKDGKVEHFTRERCETCYGAGLVQAEKSAVVKEKDGLPTID